MLCSWAGGSDARLSPHLAHKPRADPAPAATGFPGQENQALLSTSAIPPGIKAHVLYDSWPETARLTPRSPCSPASKKQKLPTRGLCHGHSPGSSPVDSEAMWLPGRVSLHLLPGTWSPGSGPLSPGKHFSFYGKATALDSPRSRRKRWRSSVETQPYRKSPTNSCCH